MKFGMIGAGTLSRASPSTWSREVTTWSSATAAARTPSAPSFEAFAPLASASTVAEAGARRPRGAFCRLRANALGVTECRGVLTLHACQDGTC